MKNRNNSIFPASFMLLSLISCSSTQYMSQPAPLDIVIEGERSEWNGRFETPDNEKYAIAISHNDTYLYLAFVSMNQSFKRSVIGGGYSIWFDTKGGKRDDLGVIYKPKMTGRTRGSQHTNRVNMDENDARKMPPLPQIEPEMDLIITEKGSERLGPADLIAGVNAFDDELFFEIQIPLSLLSEFDGSGKLGVGFQSNAQSIRPESRPQRGARPGGMQSAGGRGGGRSGGRGDLPNRSRQSEEIKTWFVVQFK